MKRNVIILTSGLAGSSVLTGLIASAGYWAGNASFKKHDYDTHENQELIALNLRILQEAQLESKHGSAYLPEEINGFVTRMQGIDPAPYRDFVEECNRHQPWIWKDPRLSLTIRYWWQFLDSAKVRFLLVRRDYQQSWVSQTIRRQISTPHFHRKYESGIANTILQFFWDNNLTYFDVVYEDLLLYPEETIGKLNAYLGSAISMENLTKIYRGALYRKPRGWRDSLKANLIYMWNYSERIR